MSSNDKFVKPQLPSRGRRNKSVPHTANSSDTDVAGEKAPMEPSRTASVPDLANTNAEEIQILKTEAKMEADLRKSFNECIRMCNNMMIITTTLRKSQTLHHNKTLQLDTDLPESNVNEQLSSLRTLASEVEKHFFQLANYSTRLPQVLPLIEKMKMMNLYIEEEVRGNADFTNKIDNMVDLGYWNEGQYQSFSFISRFLYIPATHHPRKTFGLNRIPLPPPVFSNKGTAAHNLFVSMYYELKKECIRKKYGIHSAILHRAATGSVMEFKVLGSLSSELGPVYTMKFLLVENFGIIDHVNMIAPEEDWSTVNFFGPTTVSPCVPSKHKLYQLLTKTVNKQLSENFRQPIPWTKDNLLQFVHILAKCRKVLVLKCNRCKVQLRHFFPPTCFDLRTPGVVWHSSCQNIL